MSSSHHSYRDRIYIVKDIILKLVEYGQLNPTALISFCGLNFKKHIPIINKMESKGLIIKDHILIGKRAITNISQHNKESIFVDLFWSPMR
jgi:predicted transcriptional regulator